MEVETEENLGASFEVTATIQENKEAMVETMVDEPQILTIWVEPSKFICCLSKYH